MAKKKKPGKSAASSKRKTLNSASSLKYLFIAIIIIAIGLLAALKFFHNSPNEITKNDVIANHVPAKDIEFFGVKLGDSIDKVRNKVGKPDYNNTYKGGIENLEYEHKLGLDQVGILFHAEAGIVTSITLKESFNKYLKGESAIQYSKEDMLRKFGVATPVEAVYPYMVYTYKNFGFKVIMEQNQQAGWIFFL